MISRTFVRSTLPMITKAKSSAIPRAKFLSTVATAQAPSNQNQNVVANGGPIRSSSRLKEARALVQDVWSIYNAANLPPDCINLGQGYMDFAPPSWIREAAEEALRSAAANHYSHPKGRLRLREALKKHYEAGLGRSLDVETEILVTSGANEGQYSIFTAFLERGDEVILFEPFFDQYLSFIALNGGVPVYVPLHPHTTGIDRLTGHDWKIHFDELRRAVTPKTKMILLNTPHNPVGKVFTRKEIEAIADIAKEFNLLVVSDEVYDCLLYDGQEHVRIATLPGMWERTVTVGSAGKLFSATGWRVGWLVGPESIIKPTFAVSTKIIFCPNSPLQEAAAVGLERAKEHNLFATQVKEYAERRDALVKVFDDLGMKYTLPQGSCFVLLDISDLEIPDDFPFPESIRGRGRDFKACWFIAIKLGVSSIPVSDFYCEGHRNIGEVYARFAFCKDLNTLHAAAERLKNLAKYLRNE